ncbi:tRNA delta(2)-isopentenylpyrophosphate transferase [Neisseria meningitidis]|nr:tRNA delta(2)-isopentenylpyrophosphate transferase [Neisseria meningitidis]MCE9734957.1 tRNA delta(2)-isopentenylpyrophosphate transferase [Neisseria meningitidis]
MKWGGFQSNHSQVSPDFLFRCHPRTCARMTLSVLEPEIFGRIRMMANQSAHCFARLSEWWFRRPSPLRWTLFQRRSPDVLFQCAVPDT